METPRNGKKNNRPNSKEWIPLLAICAAGKCPLAFSSARKKAANGTLPAAKIAGKWHSTEELMDAFILKEANVAALALLKKKTLS